MSPSKSEVDGGGAIRCTHILVILPILAMMNQGKQHSYGFIIEIKNLIKIETQSRKDYVKRKTDHECEQMASRLFCSIFGHLQQ